MAVIRLELEVDSEVYPELHAALVAVSSSASRGERFRQLAATGLVWETVRVHGASVTRIQGAPFAAVAAPAPAPAPVPAPVPSPSPSPSPAPAPAFASGDRIGNHGVGHSADKAPAERRAPKSNGDFIDLALNAAPAAADADEPVDAQTRNDPLHIPLRQIPMLMDVVNPPPELRETVVPMRTRVEAPAPMAERQDAPPSQPPAIATFGHNMADVPESTPEGTSAPAAEEDLAPKTPVRSRLMRMKEMGLFKNG